MVDTEAVNLVREALKSGKTEAEVVALMKQAGYTDPAISEILTEAKRDAYPVDELARRIAEKNKIKPSQDMPKPEPQTVPTQQPMGAAPSNINKSIIGLLNCLSWRS